MVKISYDMPEKEKNKLDREADEAGTRVVDYHKNSHYTRKLKTLFSVGLIVYLIMGVILGVMVAEQETREKISTDCINNAKAKFGFNEDYTVKNLVDICGYTMNKHGLSELIYG